MRSPERWLLVVALLCSSGTGRAQAPVPPAPALSASAVMQAASAVEADPLMGSIEQRPVLRWKDKSKERTPDAKELDGWMSFIRNLSTGLRLATWLVLTVLFLLILLRLRDWVQRRGRSASLDPLAPTHVGSLDIRPQSLPEHIGAAARALLDQGETRAALSLLYRGALSRLVHAHAVPIRAASTERECLSLAAPRLAAEQHAFLARLVLAWQAVAYAHRDLPADELAPLCQNFDAALGAAPGAGT